MSSDNSANRFLKDFASVFFSNGVVLLSSIFTGLVVPKLLGVTNYGYYKIFTLYLGYTALFHFGFVDGILLRHAGETYDGLDKQKFRCNSQFFIKFQMLLSVLIIILATVIFKGTYKFIFIMLGIDTFSNNLTSYYQYVSQSTMRFKELSIRKILQAVFKIFITIVFYLLHFFGFIEELSCEAYIICLVVINLVLLIWYIFTYRDITFGKRYKLKENKESIIDYFKTGIILTVAFQCSNLVFSLDRQFVSLLFTTEEYGVYSFAYSLTSMVTSMVGSLSLVLFPTLRRESKETVIGEFSNSMSLIAILVFAVHIGYYPLCAFIKWFLPDYAGSLVYLQIIFPGLAISTCISIIIFTYYKVLDKNLRYLIICLITLACSATFNGIAYLVFRTPEAISWASIISLLVWYLMGEQFFIKEYHVKWKKNLLYILIMMPVFYLITGLINNEIIATAIYIVAYGMITLLFYRKLIQKYLKRLK